jgi:hypothetical protein
MQICHQEMDVAGRKAEESLTGRLWKGTMAKPTKALIALSGKYADMFTGFFKEYARTAPDNLVHVPVTDYQLEDGYFIAVEFYPATLNGKWVRFQIPKHEVVAIAKLENMEDRSKVGF